MKSILIKFIFCICIVISMNACHTFQHQNIFLHKINETSNKKLFDKENKNSKLSVRKSIKDNEMAPIDIPKQTETVKKLALQKKEKTPNANNELVFIYIY